MLAPVFRNLSGQNVMMAEISEEQGIIDYQWHMVQENPIKGLLALSCMVESGKVMLCWKISSLQPLASLFARRKFTVQELIFIVKQLYYILENINELMLDCERLLLDNRFILADPDRMTLSFAYGPVLKVDTDENPVRRLLLGWLQSDCRIKGIGENEAVSLLLAYLDDASFHWTCLSKIVFVVKDSKANERSSFSESGLQLLSKDSRDLNAKAVREKDKIPENPSVPFGNRYRDQMHESAKKLEYDKLNRDNTNETERKSAKTSLLSQLTLEIKDKPLAKVLKIALLQVIAISAVVFAYQQDMFKIEGGNEVLSLAGIALILIAVEFLAFSGKKPAVTMRDEKVEQRRPSNLLKTSRIAKGNENREAKQQNKGEDHFKYSYQGSSIDDYTPPTRKMAFVVVNNEDVYPPILITKTPFIIGRFREKVDGFLAHPAIGKYHAEVREENAKIMLIDLNSRNGTKINGVRVAPYTATQIHKGDTIVFAADEFKFEVEDS